MLEAWKARFAAARSEIGVHDKGIRISHDPSFETERVEIKIQAESGTDFRHKLEKLARAVQDGRMDQLFQALTVEPIDTGRSGG